MKKEEFTIKGMSCTACASKIQTHLKDLKGIKKVSVDYASSKAKIEYNDKYLTTKDLQQAISAIGYRATFASPSFLKTALLVMAMAIFLLIIENYLGIANIVSAIPLAEVGMGYGMLFIIGLLTSFHCISMCGGLVMSQCITKAGENSEVAPWQASLLYNTGRILAYTLIGGLIGAIGSVFSFTPTMQGLIQLLGGSFMVIMGLNLLNVFPWLRKLNLSMPKKITQKLNQTKRGKGPFYVGMANGLMPCGPLQAMQIFALATGNLFAGAFAMFVFSLGTVPLMFGLGALSGLMSKRFSTKIMATGAVLVVILGIGMFNRGLTLSGITFGSGDLTAAVVAKSNGDYQVVQTTMHPFEYESIAIAPDLPVVWNINVADASVLNGCNNRLIAPEFEIEKTLAVGDNLINFTPTAPGTFSYSCWMGMISGSIIVQ